MKNLKNKVFDFILQSELYSRKEGSKQIRKYFGEEGYQYYQDLWRRGCLRINEWQIVIFTGKGWDEEQNIKRRGLRTSCKEATS